jgi:bifunctional non-homologous end joining protein LigD
MSISEPVKKPKATWVEPAFEAEVAYSTAENGLLREAVFKGAGTPPMPLAFNTG